MSDPSAGSLALSRRAMAELGDAVVRRLVRHYMELGDGGVGRVADPEELAPLSREGLPARPTPVTDVLAQLDRDVWPNLLRIHHPRFFGFITSPSSYVGAMADALASGINPFAGTWLEGSGPAAVERAVLGWLREWLDLPPGWGGHFTPGGSLANLTALAAARHALLSDDTGDAVLYGSDQTHSSVRRAAWLLGLRAGQIRFLPSDGDFRLDVPALDEAIRTDLGRGLRPWCLVVNAGSTNTGAVDPLESAARVCRERDLWLHVDGCYGLAAAFGPRRRREFAGLEDADSLSIDAHKWLFQPYECGCVLLKDPVLLPRAFGDRPAYLQDTEGGLERVNFAEEGLQLTRRFRALKLWMTVKVFGREALEAAVERGIELARFAARELARRPRWTVVAPAALGIVAFRRESAGSAEEQDATNRRLVTALLETGFAFVSSSVLEGRVVLRMNTINPATTEADVVATLELLERLARSLERHPGSGRVGTSPPASGDGVA